MDPTTNNERTYSEKDASADAALSVEEAGTAAAAAEAAEVGARDGAVSRPKFHRSSNRLKPHEPAGPNDHLPSDVHRFCWNIGFWMKDLIGVNGISTDYKGLESLLEEHAPFTARSTPGSSSPNSSGSSSRQSLSPWESTIDGIAVTTYRCIRARIIVGFMVIHEHNQRAYAANMRAGMDARAEAAAGAAAAAAEPRSAHSPSQQLKAPAPVHRYINMGISQAQMICYRTDVSRAGAVFKRCVAEGVLPAIKGRTSAECGKAASRNLELFFPAQLRRALYRKLAWWYAETNIPKELTFVLPEVYDSQSSTYDVRPPPLPMRR